jgi:hypothetical protein
MTASWPEELAQHRSSEEKLVPDGCGGVESLVFRGLRVRMGVFTGSAYTTSLHPVTGDAAPHALVAGAMSLQPPGHVGGRNTMLLCRQPPCLLVVVLAAM